MLKQKSLQKQKSFKPWRRRVLAAALLAFCFLSLVVMLTQHSRVKLFPLLSHRSLPSHKLAFCFIARNRIPLDVVWNAFFWGHEGKFSIYVHSRPGFVLNQATTRSSYLFDREINDSIQEKGLEGEIVRRTLTHTSWDLSSSKFRERRGWHQVTHKLADVTPPLIQSIRVCFLEFLALAIFNEDGKSFSRGHLRIFISTLFIIDGMHKQDIDNVYYETEYRREWCSSKGKPSSFFLFARKFTKPTT